MVQLYLIIQNILATIDTHALNINSIQGIMKGPMLEGPQNKDWRGPCMSNTWPCPWRVCDPRSRLAQLSSALKLPSTFQYESGPSVLRAADLHAERRDAVSDLWEGTVLSSVSCPCFWESYSPKVNIKHTHVTLQLVDTEFREGERSVCNGEMLVDKGFVLFLWPRFIKFTKKQRKNTKCSGIMSIIDQINLNL